jgi:hypothetical protein
VSPFFISKNLKHILFDLPYSKYLLVIKKIIIMGYSLAFAYNPSQVPIGTGYTQQYGDITVGYDGIEWAKFPTIDRWWEGPDLSIQYIIAWSNTGNTQPTSVSGVTASVQFWGSKLGLGATDQGFIDTINTFPRFVGEPIVNTPFSGVTRLANEYYTNYGLVDGSMSLNGNSYVYTDLSGFTPGTGSFTYECYFKKTNLSVQGGLWNTRSGDTSDGFDVAVTTTGSIVVTWQGITLMTTDNNLVIPKIWYHIAVTRNGSLWKLFLNGILRATYTSGQDLTSTTMMVGCQALGVNKFIGNISNFRYNDAAIYNSDFTPSQGYLNPQLVSTQFCMNTFVGDLWLVDDSQNFLTINTYGTPANDSINPFNYVSTYGLQLYLDAGNYVSYPSSGTTWFDLSANHNDALLSSGTSYTTASGSINFNGTSGKATFTTPSNIPTGNTTYTVSVFFNASSTGGNKGFIGWGNYGTANQVNAIKIGGTSYNHYWWANDISGGFINANTWHQVTVTYDGYWRRLFVDGSVIAQDIPGNDHFVPNANNLTVGLSNGTEYFPGKISQVLIYNRALGYSEVATNYYSTSYRYV